MNETRPAPSPENQEICRRYQRLHAGELGATSAAAPGAVGSLIDGRSDDPIEVFEGHRRRRRQPEKG